MSTYRIFGRITEDLAIGARVAETCARTFESVDSQLAKVYQGEGRWLENHSIAENAGISDDASFEKEKPKELYLESYFDRAKDAEYARLCKLSYDALKEKDPAKAFAELLRKDSYLPEDDPIKHISDNQVQVIESIDGFSALIIKDGDRAIVIFGGTNGDAGDFISDGLLTLNKPSTQSVQANVLIDQLSKKYSDIVVTGHSLGGYLATSVTLNHENVSKCIAFDPPGRYDGGHQNLFHDDRVSKVTTYESKGSVISAVGMGVGDIRKIEVEENGNALTHNHGIKEICDALGGKEAIHSSWG